MFDLSIARQVTAFSHCVGDNSFTCVCVGHPPPLSLCCVVLAGKCGVTLWPTLGNIKSFYRFIFSFVPM